MPNSAVQAFKNRNATVASALLADFLKSPGAAKHAPLDFLKSAGIYEFDWGFVAETTWEGGYFWEIYVSKVWRSGTRQWFDRFLTAYQNLGRPIVDEKFQETRDTPGKINIVHDDGYANWSALSFAALSGDTQAARVFFADTLLGEILPELIAKALDRHYRFEHEWYCA